MTIPKMFKLSFAPGSQVTDADFARFEPFHPRAAGLSNLDYAKSLESAGMGIHIGAREAVENFAMYKLVLAQAKAHGVPVIVTTGEVGAPVTEYDEAAKAAALAAARSGVVAPPTSDDPNEAAKLAALHAARNPTT